MKITDTISLLELFIVSIGLLGIGVFGLMMALLWSDRQVLKEAGQNGVDMRNNTGNMRNIFFWSLIVLLFILLGLRAMAVPEPVRQANQQTNELFLWAFISIEVIAVLAILWDYADRRANMRDLERLQHQEALKAAQHRRRHDDPPPIEPMEMRADGGERERLGEAEYKGGE